MKSKKELQVPSVITDPARELEGLYTPDEIKWSARALLAKFANSFESLGEPILFDGRTVLITNEKPDWLLHPLSTVSAASVRLQKDEEQFGYLGEFPAGPWGSVVEAYDDCMNEIEIAIDIPRERVLTLFPDGRHWINPIHKNFFEAINDRIGYLFEEGVSVEANDMHLIFFPFAKKVSFFLYPDSAVAS